MIGKIIGGAFLSVAGFGGLFLGLMFLIASGNNSSRLVTGAIFLAAGALLFILGLRFFIKGMRQSPSSLEKNINRAGAKYNGEVPEAALFAEIGKNSTSEAFVAEKVRAGVIQKTEQNGTVCYIFPSLRFSLQQKYCPYCGKDYPVRHEIETCPTCGGDLKLRKTGTSGGDEYFSLDIEE